MTRGRFNWSTWVTRQLPDRAESGGGLLVAAIQIALLAGAALGGVAIDTAGTAGPILVSSGILLTAAILTAIVLRPSAAA